MTRRAMSACTYLRVLPVPPHPVRPSVAFDASTRSEDDLTVKLMEIVRTNKNLQRQEQNGAPQHVISEFTELLQYHIMTFMVRHLCSLSPPPPPPPPQIPPPPPPPPVCSCVCQCTPPARDAHSG